MARELCVVEDVAVQEDDSVRICHLSIFDRKGQKQKKNTRDQNLNCDAYHAVHGGQACHALQFDGPFPALLLMAIPCH